MTLGNLGNGLLNSKIKNQRLKMRTRLVMDVECYQNYFLVMFRRIDKDVLRYYEQFEGQALDIDAITGILKRYQIVTFNGNNYDMLMVTMALRGATCERLKRCSDAIIVGQLRNWQFEQQFNVKVPTYVDHIDLIEPAFGQGSLKLYAGRLHSKRLQDLPIEPSALITEEQRAQLRDYCGNSDLPATIDLLNHLTPQIKLREHMTAEYGIDLRSKSDAQIAEAVIRKEVSAILGDKPQKPNIPPGATFKYKPPEFLKFQTPELQAKLIEVAASSFVIDDKGSPVEPPSLSGQTIRIGNGVYRLGIGGLHSSETSVANYADDEYMLLDRDVASYYPAIVINCGLYPKHLTVAFLKVYKKIVDQRLEAKRNGDKVTADSLKITANGSFGKLGSKYSLLYAPDLMIQVTVTGQLALLMLIESLELVGINVVSANTDGIVIRCPRARSNELLSLVARWEYATGFVTEETQYKALFSRDVNNYVALKEKGGYKGKGAFAEVSISKNPQNNICVEAACAWLEHGTPVAETIFGCKDIRKFVTVRTVRGGAIKITKTSYDDTLTPGKKRDFLLDNGWWQSVPGPLTVARFCTEFDVEDFDVETAYRKHCGDDSYQYLGKVIRWYYATGETGALHYKATNKIGKRNKVPASDGAMPLMNLPDEFPTDIDYRRYIEETNDMLKEIGARHG